MCGREEHVAVQKVVCHVSYKKRAGDDESRKHAVTVGHNIPALDIVKADDQKYGAETIQHCIQCGEEREVGSCSIYRWMVVNQPGEEKRSDCTDSDNQSNDGRRCAVVRIRCGNSSHVAFIVTIAFGGKLIALDPSQRLKIIAALSHPAS